MMLHRTCRAICDRQFLSTRIFHPVVATAPSTFSAATAPSTFSAATARHARPSYRRHYTVDGVTQTVPHPWDSGVPRRAHADAQKSIAVIGGGITGLSAALHLLGEGRKVTVYEASGRAGGWIQSRSTDVPGGSVVFESGPRTLRPDSSNWHVMDLVDRLGLYDRVETCAKSEPAAKNRYVYYPDHLVKMPSGLWPPWQLTNFMSEPLAEGLLGGLVNEFTANGKVPEGDFSVGHWLENRTSLGLANVASAVFHGVYAGDINELSMGAIMPRFQYYLRHRGGVGKGLLKDMRAKVLEDKQWYPMSLTHPVFHDLVTRPERSKEGWERLVTSSVYSFKGGINTLAEALVKVLREHPDVTFLENAQVSGIEVRTDHPGVTIQSPSHETRKFTQAVVTIPSKKLAPLLSAPNASAVQVENVKQILRYNPSVTVMVVNLYYQSPDLLPVRGFGYLIPRDIPVDQNEELALGVVFDSDALPSQDEIQSRGTKITVMLGGRWWNGWQDSDYPSPEKGVEMARSVLKRHLNITESPIAAQAKLQKDCIPQYIVGHPKRMVDLHDLLIGPGFDGRLMVGGSSYSGVSVNDCVKSGTYIGKMIENNVIDSGLAAPTEEWCARQYNNEFIKKMRILPVS